MHSIKNGTSKTDDHNDNLGPVIIIGILAHGDLMHKLFDLEYKNITAQHIVSVLFTYLINGLIW